MGELWKIKHGRTYSGYEDVNRFKIFRENRRIVNAHNKRYKNGLETFYLGLNNMADLTLKEFENFYLTEKADPLVGTAYPCSEQYTSSLGSTPNSYDWREPSKNDLNLVAVTEVKDQGQCGSCWTFGASGTMEGSLCMQGVFDCSVWHGLSEQNMVDCASYNASFIGQYNDHGCSGGEQSNAMRWVFLNGGISSEDDYPYVSGSGSADTTCKQPSMVAGTTDAICGSTSYAGPNAELLTDAIVEKGPVTVGIDASGVAFQLYSGGVYSSTTCSGNHINHAVLTVGYDLTENYFTVKNSWGPGWGLDGYILFERGVDMCGIERDTQYALMKNSYP